MEILLPRKLSYKEKLALMKEDAIHEVSCDADTDSEAMAISSASMIKGKAAPPKVPKVFLTNQCVFNCAYCGCRCSREDKRNYVVTPAELAKIAVQDAKGNGHGIFVTSAIYKNADYTQELLAECVRIIREEHGYSGYVHAKVMPGADPALIAQTGRYANRLSVNIEVAKASGYERIAKQKNKDNILAPMQNITEQIFYMNQDRRKFATSQTTQLMAGSTDEDDRTIMILSKALYRKYRLSRVYYTSFQYKGEARGYEDEDLHPTKTPYWRMSRLYQADRLVQLYGFSPDDVTPENDPFLQRDIDPKAAWALRHMDMYPVEVNNADYETLIRVPGIGITYARRIIEARRFRNLTHDMLKMMRVSLKKSQYFITCGGIYKGGNMLDSIHLRENLTSGERQISIFDVLTADGQGTGAGCTGYIPS